MNRRIRRVKADLKLSALKWLDVGSTKYSFLSLVTAAIAAFCPALAGAFLFFGKFPAAQVCLVALGVLFGAATWLLNNADRHRRKAVERADMQGLIGSIELLLDGLAGAAAADPSSELAKSYVRGAANSLRERLEPEGDDDVVRVCIYRRDESDPWSQRDGSAVESAEGAKAAGEPVVSFSHYVSARGDRVDPPRKQFTSNQPPGASFIPRILDERPVRATSVADLDGSDPRYTDGTSPAYKAYVNLPLVGRDGQVFAMLTCDSIFDSYFTPRHQRLMRTFGRLISVVMAGQVRQRHVGKPEAIRSVLQRKIDAQNQRESGL